MKAKLHISEKMVVDNPSLRPLCHLAIHLQSDEIVELLRVTNALRVRLKRMISRFTPNRIECYFKNLSHFIALMRHLERLEWARYKMTTHDVTSQGVALRDGRRLDGFLAELATGDLGESEIKLVQSTLLSGLPIKSLVLVSFLDDAYFLRSDFKALLGRRNLEGLSEVLNGQLNTLNQMSPKDISYSVILPPYGSFSKLGGAK